MSALELAAAFITLAAVYLTTRQVIWCWPLGMIGVVLYAAVFYQARLYANMGLQLVYFTLAAYGWWAWLHGGEDHGELRVRRAKASTTLLLLVCAAIAGLLLSATLERMTDASMPLVDATLTSFSIAAQLMQARKLLENWLLWIAVDVVYVAMFIVLGLYPTAALYGAFLVLAASGFVAWRRSMAARVAVAASEIAP